MRITLLTLLLFVTSIAFGQRKIKVHEERESIGSGTNNALVAIIYESTVNDIEKAWKKLMKDYNAKVTMKKEIFADDATIKDLSSNSVDIYSFVRKAGDNEFEIVVAVDLGGAYLSSSEHSSKYKTMERIVKDFAVQTTLDAIKEKQKAAQKILDGFTKDQENLVKGKEHLEKQIEDYKSKITTAENDIEKNKTAQAEKEKEIENQKKIVEEITAKEKAVD
jgi:hypothetical protein